MAAVALTELDETEPSYEEARMRLDWPEWQKVIDVELENLQSAGTWEVVERPVGINIVDSKWVFRLIAGFMSLFHKENLTIFSYGKKRKKLAMIPL